MDHNKANRISEDMLEGVNGGMGGRTGANGDDPVSFGKCPFCTTILKKVRNYYQCPDCMSKFDRNGKLINDLETDRFN